MGKLKMTNADQNPDDTDLIDEGPSADSGIIDYVSVRERLQGALSSIPADIRKSVVGRDTRTIGRYKSRPETIQLGTLARIAKKTGISLDWLVFGRDHKVLLQDEEIDLPADDKAVEADDTQYRRLLDDEEILHEAIRATREMDRLGTWGALSSDDFATIVTNLYRHICRERDRAQGINRQRIRFEADKTLPTIYETLMSRK